MTKDDTDQMFIIQRIVEIADFLSSTEYRQFHDRFKKNIRYMPHTLIAYILHIFSIFIKMAKNSHVIMKFKIVNQLIQKK